MATAAQFLEVANSQLGVAEDPPGSNRNKFTAWYGMIGAWCAMFQSWCFAQIGMTQLHAAWVDDFVQHAKDGSWGKWINQYDAIQPGDLAIFDWDGGSSDHIAAVNRVYANGQWESIEGNWADQVTRVTRGRDNIRGFVRPNWSGASVPVTQGSPAVGGNATTIVKTYQTELNIFLKSQKRPTISVDGVPGPQTKAALKSFQEFANGMYAFTGSKTRLVVDGVYGPATSPVLRWWSVALTNPVPKKLALPPATPNLHTGSPSGDSVRKLQAALNRILGTKLVVDGEFGPETRDVLRVYQASHRLVVDGIYGPATFSAMQKEAKLVN